MKLLREDLMGELGAISQCQDHIDSADNEKVRELLSRIRDDEKEHVAELTKIIQELDEIQARKFEKKEW
ncbi:MAG: ferritin-like domain-containing protein [Euryarchaeota archaeon]|nr:ferritin-like domain-containing protein [Euryarchaeota archaeon]